MIIIRNLRLSLAASGVRRTPLILWNDAHNYRYRISLAVDENDVPLRPFAARDLDPRHGRRFRQSLYREEPQPSATGRTAELDATAKRHAPMVAAALAQAEREGLYEAAIAERDRAEAERVAQAERDDAANMRAAFATLPDVPWPVGLSDAVLADLYRKVRA